MSTLDYRLGVFGSKTTQILAGTKHDANFIYFGGGFAALL